MKRTKIKKLRNPPSMSDRKRYVFFRVHCSRPFDFSEMRNAVNDSLLNWMGSEKFAKAKPWVIKNLWNGRQGVIQCSHKYADDVKLGLSLISQIGDARIIFQTLRVSGTLKSGKEKLGMRK